MYMNKGQLLRNNQTRHDQNFSPKVRIKGEHSRYDNIFIPSYNKSDLMNSIMLLTTSEDVHETKSTASWINQTCHSQILEPKICNRGEHSIFDHRFIFMIQRNGNSSDLMTSIMLLITPEGCNETNKGHNIVHYSNTPLPNLLPKDLQ